METSVKTRELPPEAVALLEEIERRQEACATAAAELKRARETFDRLGRDYDSELQAIKELRKQFMHLCWEAMPKELEDLPYRYLR